MLAIGPRALLPFNVKCVVVLLCITMATTRLAAAFSASAMSSSSTMDIAKLQQMEETVRRYFQGVNEKDPSMIASCFGDSAKIYDVCALRQDDQDKASSSNGSHGRGTLFPSTALVSRCMDFVAAHPDCCVNFYYGPECGRTAPHWVVAHWYETGTWSGSSCNLTPSHEPMAVEGQTRFLVNPETLHIEELVVTRTFTEWEKALLLQQPQSSEPEDE
ncbi:hypothetical protein MPSEU_000583500 [Mayamaea pseudoterrestris]|nr:hypothetical protein MPSEU_000583500 [Mayamaea pseudoterrestris]